MSAPQFSPYKDELTKAMTFLAEKEDTIFIGQQIVYAGNPMSTTLGNVPKEKMIEVPVMEETQMGMSLGMAIIGKSVITFYPRWDFLVSAANQLINHADKFEHMTGKGVNIISLKYVQPFFIVVAGRYFCISGPICFTWIGNREIIDFGIIDFGIIDFGHSVDLCLLSQIVL
jgi:hypothetical protein